MMMMMMMMMMMIMTVMMVMMMMILILMIKMALMTDDGDKKMMRIWSVMNGDATFTSRIHSKTCPYVDQNFQNVFFTSRPTNVMRGCGYFIKLKYLSVVVVVVVVVMSLFC